MQLSSNLLLCWAGNIIVKKAAFHPWMNLQKIEEYQNYRNVFNSMVDLADLNPKS